MVLLSSIIMTLIPSRAFLLSTRVPPCFAYIMNTANFISLMKCKKSAQRLKQVKVVCGTRAKCSHIDRTGWLNENSLYTGFNTLLSRMKIMNIDEKTRLD